MRTSVYVWMMFVAMAGFLYLAAAGVWDVSGEVVIFFGLAISSYVGTDQLAGILKTKAMPAGEKFTGNRYKLGMLTIGTLVLAMEAAILSLAMDTDLPVSGMFAIYLAQMALLAGGEKGKTAVEGSKQ